VVRIERERERGRAECIVEDSIEGKIVAEMCEAEVTCFSEHLSNFFFTFLGVAPETRRKYTERG
jgi:hypothetical protein